MCIRQLLLLLSIIKKRQIWPAIPTATTYRRNWQAGELLPPTRQAGSCCIQQTKKSWNTGWKSLGSIHITLHIMAGGRKDSQIYGSETWLLSLGDSVARMALLP